MLNRKVAEFQGKKKVVLSVYPWMDVPRSNQGYSANHRAQDRIEQARAESIETGIDSTSEARIVDRILNELKKASVIQEKGFQSTWAPMCEGKSFSHRQCLPV